MRSIIIAVSLGISLFTATATQAALTLVADDSTVNRAPGQNVSGFFDVWLDIDDANPRAIQAYSVLIDADTGIILDAASNSVARTTLFPMSNSVQNRPDEDDLTQLGISNDNNGDDVSAADGTALFRMKFDVPATTLDGTYTVVIQFAELTDSLANGQTIDSFTAGTITVSTPEPTGAAMLAGIGSAMLLRRRRA